MANEISQSSHRPGVSLGKLRMLMRVNTDAALAYLRHSPESESRSELMASGKETKEKTSEQRKTEKEAAEEMEDLFEQGKTQKEAVEAFLANAWDNLMNHPVGRKKTSEHRKTEKEAVETLEKVSEQVTTEKEAAETKENVSEQEKSQKEAVEAFLAEAWDNLMNYSVGMKRRSPRLAYEQAKTQKEAVEAFLAEARNNLMNHPGDR